MAHRGIRQIALCGPLPPAPADSWEELMHLALAQARKGAEQGEVPVGAVLLDCRGQVLGAAHNACISSHDPTAHAEILALRQAARATGNYRLEGSVLVVSLEPCLMCAAALVHARVQGLVYGAADSLAGAVSSCLEALALPFHNHKVWHMGGVLSAECAGLLQDFFALRRP